MKPALALAVSGGLAQAARPEVAVDGLLAPARQQTMESGHGASEAQAHTKTADDLSLTSFQELMSELEVPLSAHAAACTADAQPSLAEYSAESRLHSLLAISDRAGSVAEHLSNLTSQIPDFKSWLHDNMKPAMVRVLEPMVTNKTLTERMATLRSMTTDEDSSLEALLKDVNQHIRKLNTGATGSGKHIKLKFEPPLVLHLRDGRQTDGIESMNLNAGDLTAEIYSNIFKKYRNNLKKVKDDESAWFSTELASKKDMDFYEKYAEACIEDGSFLGSHVWAIQTDLGQPWVERAKCRAAARFAVATMRRLASPSAGKTSKQLSGADTAKEGKSVQSFVTQMSDGKNPFELLMNRARDLQEKGDDKDQSKVKAFADDIPIAVGWLLDHDSFKGNIKKIIADFAKYMMDEGNKQYFNGASLLDASTDLPLAPEQLRMLSCSTSKVANAALFQQDTLFSEDNKNCFNCCCYLWTESDI